MAQQKRLGILAGDLAGYPNGRRAVDDVLDILDCYAWSLAAGGRFREADVAIRKALATGVKDPKILAHSATIMQRLSESASLNGTRAAGR